MNDGKKIREAQNEERAIQLLAAQREMYTRAKRWNAAGTVASLGLPLILTAAQAFWSLPPHVIALAAFLTFVAGYRIGRKVREMVSEAAGIQQSFDSYVYSVDFQAGKVDDCTVQRFAGCHLAREGAGEKLKDWYTVRMDNASPGSAVASCQHQNVCWSESLLSRYRIAGLMAGSIVVAILVALVLALQVSWENLFFLPTVLEWVLRRYIEVQEARTKVRDLSHSLGRYTLDRHKDILETQSALFEYRRSGVLIPDWFYELFKERDERVWGSSGPFHSREE